MNQQLVGLKAAMEVLPDGLIVVDHKQEIVCCNRLVETLFGYRRGELLGKSLSILIPPESRKSHAKLVVGHDPCDSERTMDERPILYGIAKSGDRLPLSIAVSSCGDSEDRLFIAIVRDARSMDDTLHGVKILAETDPLTKLGNRRYLSSLLEEMEQDPQRAIAILYMDLDRFKPLNDRFGHDVGDEVLKIVGLRLRNSLRDHDHCIRLGGDEFAIVLVDLQDAAALERVASKVHERVTAPIHVGGESIRLGVSIGSATGAPNVVTGEVLLKHADEAMYYAKSNNLSYQSFEALKANAA